jgi:hypothetical protein
MNTQNFQEFLKVLLQIMELRFLRDQLPLMIDHQQVVLKEVIDEHLC